MSDGNAADFGKFGQRVRLKLRPKKCRQNLKPVRTGRVRPQKATAAQRRKVGYGQSGIAIDARSGIDQFAPLRQLKSRPFDS